MIHPHYMCSQTVTCIQLQPVAVGNPAIHHGEIDLRGTDMAGRNFMQILFEHHDIC